VTKTADTNPKFITIIDLGYQYHLSLEKVDVNTQQEETPNTDY